MIIGLQKTATLSNGTSGDFWRTGDVIFQYTKNNFGKPLNIKVVMLLFKDMSSLFSPYDWLDRRTIHVQCTYDELNQTDLMNKLYERIMIIDSYFSDAVIIDSNNQTFIELYQSNLTKNESIDIVENL